MVPQQLCVCACLFVAAVLAVHAAPAEDAKEQPQNPLTDAFDRLLKEGPERVKMFRENVRKNSGTLRERLGEGVAKLIPRPSAMPGAMPGVMPSATPLSVPASDSDSVTEQTTTKVR